VPGLPPRFHVGGSLADRLHRRALPQRPVAGPPAARAVPVWRATGTAAGQREITLVREPMRP
jgi:hypothetical protein